MTDFRDRVVPPSAVAELILRIRAAGYNVIGPTIEQDAIVYAEIESAEDLPVGWTQGQEAGRYRLEARADRAWFGYNVGPTPWKRFLHPPRETLFQLRTTDSWKISTPAPPPAMAFLGVRSCELAAIAIQDRVFTTGPHVDELYRARRLATLIIATQCTVVAPTCFCSSMATGPKVDAGHDLCLTEFIRPGSGLDGDGHEFLLEIGSERGAVLASGLEGRYATPPDRARQASLVTDVEAGMQRMVDTHGVRELLRDNPNNPRWDDVAQRCLACGNCTMVCPTCFCSTVTEIQSLDASTSGRERSWDSCFTTEFTHLHQGPVRSSTKSRYRQWLTHKFSTWIDQFGSSGCVGCGRCITWCPPGIDVTAELAAIRQTSDAPQPENRS